jgi:hypothetical protein
MIRQWCLISISALILVAGSSSLAASAPDLPPHPCYQGCTSEMSKIWELFRSSPVPVSLEPAVYSGKCQYLSPGFNPEEIHYAVVMIDHLDPKVPFFSTIFAFFAPQNVFADWDLEAGRREMSPYWKNHGKILEGSNTSRVEIEDSGHVVNAYWMRQNPITKDLYYITYMGPGYLKAFCLLREHPARR